MKKEYLITLLETNKIGRKTVKSLVQNLNHDINSIEDLFEHIQTSSVLNKRIHVPKFDDLKEALDKANSILKSAEESNIEVFSVFENKFPVQLKIIPDSPLILYVKGNPALLNTPSVAVIGTRDPSQIGVKLGARITKILTEHGYTITSGLAIGCDTIAHETCINSNGKTIAVLANGLKHIYPNKNKKLGERILETAGVLVSEYTPEVKPRNNYFVERDRIQSGLSSGICVIETDIKGGTMHTVNFAGDQGKIIGCIDHPMEFKNQPKCRGNQMLINSGRALPIGNPEEVSFFIKSLNAPRNRSK